MKKANRTHIFTLLSTASVGSLFLSFAGVPMGYEVYKQQELNQFNIKYDKVFIFSEKQLELPYGFNSKKAVKISSVYNHQLWQKIILLTTCVISSCFAIAIEDVADEMEINQEVGKIKTASKKQLAIEKIKHQYAMMSLAQRELFKEEIKALLELTGGDETLEASEINDTDKFIHASYMLSDVHSLDFVLSQVWGVSQDSPEFQDIKNKFLQWQQNEV